MRDPVRITRKFKISSYYHRICSWQGCGRPIIFYKRSKDKRLLPARML